MAIALWNVSICLMVHAGTQIRCSTFIERHESMNNFILIFIDDAQFVFCIVSASMKYNLTTTNYHSIKLDQYMVAAL